MIGGFEGIESSAPTNLEFELGSGLSLVIYGDDAIHVNKIDLGY